MVWFRVMLPRIRLLLERVILSILSNVDCFRKRFGSVSQESTFLSNSFPGWSYAGKSC